MNSAIKEHLQNADLLVDEIYEGGRRGNAADDPLGPLIGVSNQGGFRVIGKKTAPKLIVLTSTFKDPDWPDDIDKENGIYTYFGDNKKPGRELHDTPRYGNHLLRYIFDKSHGSADDRLLVPPIFIFTNTGNWRDVKFLGLAVPGAESLGSNSDLVAVWKLKNGNRFQNYLAKFTILNAQLISRKWIDDIKAGNPLSNSSPDAWRLWVENRSYKALKAPRTLNYRSKLEQLPSETTDVKLIQIIQEYFANEPVRFEACAAKIAEMILKKVVSLDLTRPTRDGGRDALGKLQLGEGDSSILIDFALEAKCYSFSNPVTVKEVSRLISRLRHRQFGVLVTTSYVATQAYQEIKEDDHPIIIVSAVDIIKTLKASGLNHEETLRTWLKSF